MQEIIDLYWAGNVKAAAKQLGIPQNNLYRIVSGETLNPRANVLAKIAKFAGSTVEYLLTGEGRGPQASDEKGRRITSGSQRWFRVVISLYPKRGGVGEFLAEVPFGPLGFVGVLLDDPSGRNAGVARRKWRQGLLQQVQTTCVEAWAELLEEAINVFGADAVRERLDSAELAVAGGFTHFARFLSDGAMSKAEKKRYVSAYEDEMTRTRTLTGE